MKQLYGPASKAIVQCMHGPGVPLEHGVHHGCGVFHGHGVHYMRGVHNGNERVHHLLEVQVHSGAQGG